MWSRCLSLHFNPWGGTFFRKNMWKPEGFQCWIITVACGVPPLWDFLALSKLRKLPYSKIARHLPQHLLFGRGSSIGALMSQESASIMPIMTQLSTGVTHSVSCVGTQPGCSGWIPRLCTQYQNFLNSNLWSIHLMVFKQFCCYVIVLLRDQWMIARLSKAMGAALFCNNFSPIPSKFSFHMKKKSDLLQPDICKALKTFDCLTESV